MKRWWLAPMTTALLLSACSGSSGRTLSPTTSAVVETAGLSTASFATSAVVETAPTPTSEPPTATTVASGPFVLPSTCPDDNLTNLPPPDQVVPNVSGDTKVLSFNTYPFPEGPQFTASITDADPVLARVFAAAVAQLRLPLPAASNQGCCDRQLLTIRFVGEATAAVYGPCTYPASIERILKILDIGMVDEQKAYDAQHTAAPPPTAAPETSSDTAEIVLASPACSAPTATRAKWPGSTGTHGRTTCATSLRRR